MRTDSSALGRGPLSGSNPGRPFFGTTAWSCVLLAAGGEGDARRRALEQLMRQYWRPVYGYVRAAWRKNPEEARDLTQDFMVWLLESDFFAKADPNRGRFRHFLRTALAHFLGRVYRDEHRLKRGGARMILPLDATGADNDAAARPGQTPEQVLDEEWKRTVLESALDRLEQVLAARGDVLTFQLFRQYYLADGDPPDHRALAHQHGLTVSAVNHRLEDARAEMRRMVVDLVADSVTSAEELGQELGELFR